MSLENFLVHALAPLGSNSGSVLVTPCLQNNDVQAKLL